MARCIAKQALIAGPPCALDCFGVGAKGDVQLIVERSAEN